MNIYKIIKEEYLNLIKEQFEYNKANFNNIDDINELITLINEDILNKLVEFSKLIINLPEERRLDLSSIKNILDIIDIIKDDINKANRFSEKYEENINFEILDNLIIKCENMIDPLHRLFDNLDSMIFDINNEFDDFKNDISKYLN